MILTVRRASGFPIIIEDIEQKVMDELEAQGEWQQLEELERLLRKEDALKELKVEAEKLVEIRVFLDSIKHYGPITVNFEKGTIVVQDQGSEVC